MTNINIKKEPVILIADDSIISRKKIREMIKNFGAEIIEAVDGREAIKKIITMNIDIVLLDLLMPEVTGFEVLEFMKNNNINVPVIIISADIQETSRNKCLMLGARGFLNKPPKPEELVQIIKKFLSKK
jgi:CheY-like chemotaxis protein